MLTQVHCIGCGKILRIDAEKESAVCPKCQENQNLNQNQNNSQKRLVDLARPPITLAVEQKYSLAPSNVKRTLGSYLNCLYSILKSAGIQNTMHEWCVKVGTDKFYEGVQNGLLVLEDSTFDDDLQNRDGYVIKEQPPQQPTPKNFSVDKIVSSGNGAITAQVTYNGKTGLLRIQKDGNKEEWTTDNLDMIDPMFCSNLTAIEQEMSSDKALSPTDSGPLKYQLKSRCKSAVGYDAKGNLLFPEQPPSIDLYA